MFWQSLAHKQFLRDFFSEADIHFPDIFLSSSWKPRPKWQLPGRSLEQGQSTCAVHNWQSQPSPKLTTDAWLTKSIKIGGNFLTIDHTWGLSIVSVIRLCNSGRVLCEVFFFVLWAGGKSLFFSNQVCFLRHFKFAVEIGDFPLRKSRLRWWSVFYCTSFL